MHIDGTGACHRVQVCIKGHTMHACTGIVWVKMGVKIKEK